MTAAETLATAIRIAEAASALPMTYFRRPIGIDLKGDESPVTIADRETEAAIRRALAEAFPEDGIFGEEFGKERLDAENLWIIDPIDGTRSFITGNPLFGLLMGRIERGRPVIGIVRMPALNETFAGAPGGGATLNGRTIRARTTERLSEAMIWVNEAERHMADDPARFARLCRIGHTRRMGYDCYPHAMVAAGQIDAVIDMGLEPYDYMPLIALVEAAGGLIRDWQGKPLDLSSDGRVVTAATPALLDQVLEMLA
ncbi:MAG: inositol monophosphatase [Gemmobacter sp.]|jgi:histidinol phosphatase-like enzyme (inositol monophosphatase family)|nr:inositol monophosphatase [Gemmobacter sp.]